MERKFSKIVLVGGDPSVASRQPPSPRGADGSNANRVVRRRLEWGRVVGGNQDYKIINVQLMSNYMVINVSRRQWGSGEIWFCCGMKILWCVLILVHTAVNDCSQRCERLFTAL